MSWEITSDARARYVDYLKKTHEEDHFSKFRKNKDIRGIIEGVSESAGKSYLDKIEKLDASWLRANWHRIAENESVGSPDTVRFKDNLPPLAPVTLRYVWNGLELDRAVSLRGKSVVEIGGGYGGLARIICALFEPQSYSIIDLPEALDIAHKYLNQFNIKTKLAFLPIDSVCNVDVFIANYSVAELDRIEQEKYLNNVILRSKAGYFTHNLPSPLRSQLSRKEFEEEFAKKFDVRSYQESLHKCEMSVVYVCEEKKTEAS